MVHQSVMFAVCGTAVAKVHRALAWKLAGKVESHFPQDHVAEAAPGHDLQLPIVITKASRDICEGSENKGSEGG